MNGELHQLYAKVGLSVSGSTDLTGSLAVSEGLTLKNRHIRKIFIAVDGTKEEWTGSGDRTF